MYATRAEGPRNFERHLKRLEASASHFGFQFSIFKLRQILSIQCETMSLGMPYRLRAALNRTGDFEITASPLAALDTNIVNVLLAPDQGFSAQSSQNEFIRHKGTIRYEYDRAWRLAEERGAFDMLFFNERGELTEGGRSNVFVKLGGRWWTPPISAGLLPGIMRSIILEDPAWSSSERVLTREDVNYAEDLLVCSALRGPIKARIGAWTATGTQKLHATAGS
jgi:para-aminobenzoate synthetase / 4-amino-4-deoxychorismate lyase